MALLKEIKKGLDLVDKTISDLNNKVIGGGNFSFELLTETPIEGYCLIEMADYQLQKNMMLNLYMRDITLSSMPDVTGFTNIVSSEVSNYDYTYTEGNNYLDEYQRIDARHTTTRGATRNDNVQKYGGGSRKNFSNKLYGEDINLYPDDSDAGTDGFFETEKLESYFENNNRNSILKKTKDLFRCRKINTVISRFHTDADKTDLYSDTESATSAYGLSHGRNLLTYAAEREGLSYARNGYDNPYCRVWTHHHQYNQQRSRLIRPFADEDENGIVRGDEEKQLNLHRWGSEFEPKDENEWGWKSSKQDGWSMSVLDRETGMVNIAPKYLGGAEKNIHTKDCMFSIENLAWQGFDPYSFEKALSWEQRGPFGGRIMWFPPYGLRFSEDASVNWNEHTFIGRGENVFTYTNTSRTGTLEFMMVVDHPSILDYATWHENKPQDTDVLRFLAGCDSADPSQRDSLLNFVKATPLTDEYEEKRKDVKENEKPVEKTEEKAPTSEDVTPDENIQISFYVFFPNNYSGYFDRTKNTGVDPVAYLLCGNGAQEKCDMQNVMNSQRLPISFDDIGNSEFTGTGYEMEGSCSNKSDQDRKKNFILGADTTPATIEKVKYTTKKDKRWYYRIDGEYVDRISGVETQNCFGQTLSGKQYLDERSFGLNWNYKLVCGKFGGNVNTLFSLAEIAYALASNGEEENENQKEIKNRIGSGVDLSMDEKNKRIQALLQYFGKTDVKPDIYKITKIEGVGYSSSHGTTEKVARNKFLAEERCDTVYEWLKKYLKLKEVPFEKSVAPSQGKDGGVSSLDMKQWRSAKITISISKTQQLPLQKVVSSFTETDFMRTISSNDFENLSEEDKTKYEVSKYFSAIIGDKQYITTEEYNKLDDATKEHYKPLFYTLKEGQEPPQVLPPEEPWQQFTGFVEAGNDPELGTLYRNVNETDDEKKNKLWYYVKKKNEEGGQMVMVDKALRNDYKWQSEEIRPNSSDIRTEYNRVRYDQEYHFFKKLSERDPAIFSSLVDKLQYFDPGFHTMTPEGFMGRLNFLQQCTRQGDTLGASEENGYMANNLAFGRPPFCILRIGDFYYQKIVIRNINITYDPLVLDLNNEGVGVVPLIANVTISFNFIGGGDLNGPVRRLQNALSHNYYANGRLYDNRADRNQYQGKRWDTMKNGKIDFEKSYFHHTPQQTI